MRQAAPPKEVSTTRTSIMGAGLSGRGGCPRGWGGTVQIFPFELQGWGRQDATEAGGVGQDVDIAIDGHGLGPIQPHSIQTPPTLAVIAAIGGLIAPGP